MAVQHDLHLKTVSGAIRSEFDIPEFREDVGPTKILPPKASAKDFFSLLVDDRMLNNIVCETNKYAKQRLEESGKKCITSQR